MERDRRLTIMRTATGDRRRAGILAVLGRLPRGPQHHSVDSNIDGRRGYRADGRPEKDSAGLDVEVTGAGWLAPSRAAVSGVHGAANCLRREARDGGSGQPRRPAHRNRLRAITALVGRVCLGHCVLPRCVPQARHQTLWRDSTVSRPDAGQVLHRQRPRGVRSRLAGDLAGTGTARQRTEDDWRVRTELNGAAHATENADAEEAYGLALLHVLESLR
jgi:hypothetical protein